MAGAGIVATPGRVESFRSGVESIIVKLRSSYGQEGSAANFGVTPRGYYPRRSRVTLAAASIRDKAGAWQTVRHEVLGHYGLNTLTPEDKYELLSKIIETRPETRQRAKMNTQELPKIYKGYSTAELLDILARIPGGQAKGIPMDTMSVLNDFVREYKLTPVARWEPGRKPGEAEEKASRLS